MPGNAGDVGLIPGSGRSPGGGNDNPHQCSCLGNPMENGAWWATVHGVIKELNMTSQLHNNNPEMTIPRPLGSHTECGKSSV